MSRACASGSTHLKTTLLLLLTRTHASFVTGGLLRVTPDRGPGKGYEGTREGSSIAVGLGVVSSPSSFDARGRASRRTEGRNLASVGLRSVSSGWAFELAPTSLTATEKLPFLADVKDA